METKHTAMFVFVFIGLLFLINAAASCTFRSELPVPPVNDNKSPVQEQQSFHAQGHEDAWILSVENGVVSAGVVDSKALIFFRPDAGDINKFREGYIAPVTFDCVKDKKGECDLSKPFRLYVSNRLVKMEKIEFPKKTQNR